MRKKDKVEYILKNFPHTRDSDKMLVEEYWKVWDKKYVQEHQDIHWVRLDNLIAMTSSESITRIRRKFQEPTEQYPDGQYPPTDPIVAERRRRQYKVRHSINTENYDEHLPN